jgi:sigma-E factor negative regulatory protein RseB
MPLRRLFQALVGWSILAFATAAPAQTGAALAVSEAKAWLARIQGAASERNYQGTLVFSAGGAVSSSRIAHYCDGRQQFERIEALDGRPRRVFRHNDVVHTIWPDRRVALIELRDPVKPFPALVQGGDDGLAEHYEIQALGTDRVAGHEAQVLLLRPRDGHRFGQRVWAERSTGLLLRADILGGQDEVLESASFTEVAIGVRAQPETVLVPMKKLDGYRVLRRALARTDLEREGWSLNGPVAGFRQISCVKRSLQPAAEADAPAEVLQAIFSDGLTHVSLFIEPYNVERHARPLRTAIGATHTLMQRHGDWWITVMGDVPVATLKIFAGALERRR